MMRRGWRGLRPFTVAMAILVVLGGGFCWRAGVGPATAAAQPAQAVVEVALYDDYFSPATLTIQPNTTVRWTNRGASLHDVRGVLNASTIQSPPLPAGASFEYTFTLPGTYDYICTYHSRNMIGQIVVEGTSYTFPETGFAVEGDFLRYWRTHGLEFGDYNVSYRESLALFGYPISDPFTETIEGQSYTVQYFERARFEHHPENADPEFQVLLGQFGRIIHPADPPAAQQPGAAYFAETGHNLSGRFRQYWEENGGLAVFGFPLSEEFEEVLGDGQTYRVQYFERARFEAHPENQPPYDVLLGQFGRLVLDR
jgi:plastocyanin